MELPSSCRGRPLTDRASAGKVELKLVIVDRQSSTRQSNFLLASPVNHGGRIRVRYIGLLLTQVRSRVKAMSAGSWLSRGMILALASRCWLKKLAT